MKDIYVCSNRKKTQTAGGGLSTLVIRRNWCTRDNQTCVALQKFKVCGARLSSEPDCSINIANFPNSISIEEIYGVVKDAQHACFECTPIKFISK